MALPSQRGSNDLLQSYNGQCSTQSREIEGTTEVVGHVVGESNLGGQSWSIWERLGKKKPSVTSLHGMNLRHFLDGSPFLVSLFFPQCLPDEHIKQAVRWKTPRLSADFAPIPRSATISLAPGTHFNGIQIHPWMERQMFSQGERGGGVVVVVSV